MNLLVSQELRLLWGINKWNILESRSTNKGYPIFKFCYDPRTGEFLCGLWPSFHKEIIEKYGRRQFDDYVRGIYFREKKIVFLRQHENEKWLTLTEKFLRRYGTPNNIRIIWGEGAAKELMFELKGL